MSQIWIFSAGFNKSREYKMLRQSLLDSRTDGRTDRNSTANIGFSELREHAWKAQYLGPRKAYQEHLGSHFF